MKKAVKSFYKSLRFQLSASNNWFFLGFYRYLYSPSKGSISELLDWHSKERNGTFRVIQIGANDGITHDPIHKFIKRDKWEGVLLEPQKEVFDKYLSKLYRKNKGIITLNAAVSQKDGQMKLYKVGFSNARWATGLATFDKSVLESAFESGYVQEQAEKDGIEIPKNKESWIVAEQIETISPETLRSKFKMKQIDLLQIDVEGFDYEIIKMFDVKNSQPGLIVFENSHLSEADYQECVQLLEDSQYKVKKRGRNSVAMLNPPQGIISFFD